ncbi:putative soluble epoxide hydrolase [Helianthus annuus]|nr:putative soluble epoxide hydrolase [Helianthus annuus]
MSYEAFMKKLLTLRDPGPLLFPKGKGFLHSPPGVPVTLPPWLSEEDIEYFASQHEKAGGLTGGINYYRALHLSWELTSAWRGAKVTVPTKFVAEELDLAYYMGGVNGYINSGGMKKDVPWLEEVVVHKKTTIRGVGVITSNRIPSLTISNQLLPCHQPLFYYSQAFCSDGGHH